jgi:glycosyltransferase involved in cell wall biosynthesis
LAQDSTVSLSIVTPVLNGERFVASCLENVAAQQCEGLEHLVVDGGSIDATETIVRDHMTRTGSIRWLQEPGANQSRALNLGVQESRGRVLGVLNVDDYYEPDTLSRVIELFRDRPSPTFAAANCNAWEDDVLLYVNRPTELRFEKLLLGPDLYPFPFNPAAYFYDKSLHDVIGFYDVDDELSMDLDFLLRAVKAASVVYVDETWGNFRIHPEAKTVRDRAEGGHDRRRNRVLRRHRALLAPKDRARLYAELALRRSHLALRRARWRLGAARAALESRI